MQRIILNETSYFGAGCRREAIHEFRRNKFKKVFLATDASLVECGVLKLLTDMLDENGIKYTVFSDIVPNPTKENVWSGLKAFKKSKADVIFALGGGSVIDTAKAIGIVRNNPKFNDLVSLSGTANTMNKSVPIFAFPTTSGTAAEVTINYVITDEDRGVKMVCVDPNDIPMVAFLDAELMASMPKSITASTGMDALTHAIECLITKGAWDMSDMFALEAIKVIAKFLKRAYDNGGDIEARDKMAYAQYVAGMGFSNVGLGIVHSMAHPLGGRFNIAHGTANAMILPTVMKYNMESASLPKYRLIAEAFGVNTAKLTDEQAGKKAVACVEKLKQSLNIPKKLSELGIKEEDLDVLSVDAYNDVCTGGNPRTTSVKDIRALYKKIL